MVFMLIYQQREYQRYLNVVYYKLAWH